MELDANDSIDITDVEAFVLAILERGDIVIQAPDELRASNADRTP